MTSAYMVRCKESSWDRGKEVWNKRVAPKNYPDFYHRKVKPITWEDLKNRFHTMALRQFHIDKNGYMDRYKEEIKLFTETYDFGDVLWLHYSFIFAKNFKEVVRYIKKKGLYIFDIWGYVPFNRPKKSFAWYRPSQTPNGDAHRYLLRELGAKFLGWDNGEQDGRYFAAYAPMVCPAPKTRREAYESFSKYFYRLNNDMQNYLTALLGMYFPHYMAHFKNHRLLGAETAQALPSVPPWYAFIRGAGKQYGILWFGNASVFNRWGYKRYGDGEKKFDERQGGRWYGPEHGTSLSLLKRLWYVEYMYGCCMMGYEQGHLYGVSSENYLRSLDGLEEDKFARSKDKVPRLTPIGELQIECARWCKEHPDIGVQYTPVALLMDFYTGWAPPRTLYHTKANYIVWGNMPYEKGDYQIDSFLRIVYPRYEDASFYKDERGFLTSTPVGDIFDVLLSNVSEEVLHQYNTVVVMGETTVEGKLLDKIENFLRKGGTVIVALNQLSEEARKRFKIITSNNFRKSKISRLTEENKNIPEKLFQYEVMDIKGADVLSVSEQGDPIIVKKRYGNGELMVIAVDFGLNCKETRKRAPLITYMDMEGTEVPIPERYSLLNCVRHVILDYMDKHNFVEVLGPPIQYITNITDNPRKIFLTLVNNENKLWKGKIRIRGQNLVSVENLFNNKKLHCLEEKFEVEIKPLDVSIYSIQTDKPMMKFKKPLSEKKMEMCKLAIWSRAGAGHSIWQNVEIIGRSSFEFIEICASQVLNMTHAELTLLREEIKAGDLNISALSLVHTQTPYIDNDLFEPYPVDAEKNAELLSHILEICELLEIKRIILTSGTFMTPGLSSEQVIEVNFNAISKFAKKAGKYGIEILVQQAPDEHRLCGKLEILIRLIDKINLPNVGIALDTGHSYLLGENPLKSLKKLGSRVKYININSSFKHLGSGLIDKHLLPGEGLFDRNTLELFLKELKSTNYKEILCFNSYFPEPLMERLQEGFSKFQKYFKRKE